MAYLSYPDMFDAPDIVDEWVLIQAARWAGVPPWELFEKPAVWLLTIIDLMDVEKQLSDREIKKHKKKGTK